MSLLVHLLRATYKCHRLSYEIQLARTQTKQPTTTSAYIVNKQAQKLGEITVNTTHNDDLEAVFIGEQLLSLVLVRRLGPEPLVDGADNATCRPVLLLVFHKFGHLQTPLVTGQVLQLWTQGTVSITMSPRDITLSTTISLGDIAVSTKISLRDITVSTTISLVSTTIAFGKY